jgi:hypothetical protein
MPSFAPQAKPSRASNQETNKQQRARLYQQLRSGRARAEQSWLAGQCDDVRRRGEGTKEGERRCLHATREGEESYKSYEYEMGNAILCFLLPLEGNPSLDYIHDASRFVYRLAAVYLNQLSRSVSQLLALVAC